MRDRALLFVLSMSLNVAAQAQVISQPTPAPLVTAETTSWFSKGEPVYWNGGLYYPTRPVQPFNPYQMVRTGSFTGIPLYTDPMLEPDTIVFVPLLGGFVQPYERARAFQVLLASASILQAPSDSSRALSEPMAVGSSGRTASPAALVAAPRPITTLNPPTGLNAIWVNYDGRRWFLAGKAIDYDPATLAEVGTYHGWNVYMRNGNPSTIYIPTTPGRLAPYTAR